MTTTHAVVVQQVARLPFQAEGGGSIPTPRLQFTAATPREVAPLLATHHYLGPVAGAVHCHAGWVNDLLVAAMVWRWPTARHLPADGTWLELTRWCLTPDAGKNAGSRMMGWASRQLRRTHVTTLVSYSDPSQGHTGALYRASGWTWAPTWHRLRPPPSGNGSWNGVEQQEPKDRWVYVLADDSRRAGVLAVKDNAAAATYAAATGGVA